MLPFVVLNNKNLIISKTCLILSYIDTNKNNTLSNANSFQAFDVLLRKLQKYVPFGASVADLYAGAGAIGLSLAATRKCRHELRYLYLLCGLRLALYIQKLFIVFIILFRSVRCIEINKESKVSFEKTAGRLLHIIESSVSWHHADASKVGV